MTRAVQDILYLCARHSAPPWGLLLNDRCFGQASPLLGEEGWLRHKQMSRSLISGADGVVESAERCQPARPPRPLRCRGFAASLFMSRPPLLIEEGIASLKLGRQLHSPFQDARLF